MTDEPSSTDDDVDTATDSDTVDIVPESDAEWAILESVIEYETGWYTGGYDLVEQPDGSRKRYYWAELPPAVIIVAVEDEHVLFVQQYRPTIRQTQLELPAGIIEDGEAPPVAAARELEEETGRRPDTCRELAAYWVATGVLRHRRVVVYADHLETTTQSLDPNEFLAVKRIPVEDAVTTALDAPANDATLEGLLLAEYEGLL